ncbi:MAG TPA: STAS domain-containing protein [Acidimicrobiia bacterium]|nr:STAS domain-containing protein [Acidimicrobiia bacterium]
MAHVDDASGAHGSVECVSNDSPTLHVRLTGEIDISNADRLGAALERLIDGNTRLLSVDLATLAFMDSAGIAMLLRAAARVSSVEVRNPSDVMRRLIECTGLNEVLHIEG